MPTATVAAPRTLVAADFDPAILGAKIAGPAGTDPAFVAARDGQDVARVVSYVACPNGMTSCAPDDLPAGTVLTYVHTITPLAVEPAATPASTATSGLPEVPPALFRMTRPAPGFEGAVGYAHGEAAIALGKEHAITVTLDDGQLIWRVTSGSGWKPGAPVTVWWQTTEPPAGPRDAYEIELMGRTATARGPFPEAEKPVERNR